MNFFNYFRTQWVLKKKWLLNKWSYRSTTDFQPFVILCDPRTGSTWLHTLLNFSSEIQSYGEVLSELDVSRGLKNTIWMPHTHSIRAVGCKLFYEQLFRFEFKHILEEIISDKSIKVIDLYRRNELETFVSLKIAEDTQIWSANAESLGDKRKIWFDMDEFDQFKQKMKQNRNEILSQLAGHVTYSVSYEELLDDTEVQSRKIQRFLDVSPKKLISLLKRQNPESLKDLVANYSDLHESEFNADKFNRML